MKESSDRAKADSRMRYKIRADSHKLVNYEYRRRNKDRVNATEKARRLRLKLEAIAVYGPSCKCCGESAHEFLCIDHVGGLRGQARESCGGSGTKLQSYLRKRGWPDGYQVLCWNCNSAFGLFGYCPHKRGVR